MARTHTQSAIRTSPNHPLYSASRFPPGTRVEHLTVGGRGRVTGTFVDRHGRVRSEIEWDESPGRFPRRSLTLVSFLRPVESNV